MNTTLPTLFFRIIVSIIVMVFLPIIVLGQHLPEDFSEIRPLENKLMVKVKQGNFDKLQSAQEAIKIKSIEQRFKTKPLKAQTLSLKKVNADNIRIQDWYQIEISSSNSLEEAIKYYQNQDFIEYVEPIYPNYILAPPYVPNDPAIPNQWHLGMTQLYAAWGLHKGDTNTVIGIVDTGINDDHLDLKSQIQINYAEKYGVEGVDDDGNGYVDDSLGYSFGRMNANVRDFHGHGTAVAGMAGATTDDAFGVAGASYKCRILPVAVFSTDYQVVNMYDGILYAAERGCKVINVSIGRPNIGFQWEQDVIDYVTLVHDALVVAAAGNTNLELDFYPASYQHVLSAAHSRGNDVRWGGGTYSHYVDVMAPGVRVFSTHMNGSFNWFWGSSFASPLTAGIAALVRSAFPHLSAAQAGELVRVTADDRYSLSGNAPYLEKLGKGRVNAFRALSEEMVAKAIRMDNFSYLGRNGEAAFSGDTITMEADFINYLNVISPNGKVVLSSTSPHITVLDDVFDIGAMNTLQQKNNASTPFRFVVAQNAPMDLNVKFRLGFSDTGYDDYQYFSIPVNAPYLAIPFNTLTFTLTGNSRAGYYDIYNRLGSGLTFLGSQTLQEGGLIVGKSNTNVSDNVLTNTASIYKDNDFRLVDIPRITEKTPFHTEATSQFADTLSTITTPVGVHVHHTVKGRTNTPHHQYVILEYEFTNESGAVMDSMNVGLYYDWNLGDYTKNYADWDDTREFGYVFGTGTSGYAGIKAISDNKNYFALDFDNIGGSNIDVHDGFSSAEKYQTVSTGVARKRAGFHSAGADVAHIVGTTIYNFGVEETRKVTFVVMVASNLADLREAHDAAVLATDPTSSISPMPIVNNTLCENTSYTITPEGGTNFRLYDVANTQTPIQEGTYFDLTPADLGRSFYITNVDSVLEGDYTTLNFSVRTAEADFAAPEQVDLDETNTVFFQDMSEEAVSWQWDFGNGQNSTLQSPTTNYDAQGEYLVSLTVTDVAGCTNTVLKIIKVVRKSPPPFISPLVLQVCDNEPHTVSPSPARGTNYKFYDTQNNLLYTGTSYEVPPNFVDSIYISNIDSALESDRVLLRIQWVELTPNFVANPRYDTLLFDNVNFTNTSSSGFFIAQTRWDFGDGSPLAYGHTTRHTYSTQGRYKVKMTTTNDFGCTKTIEKWFYVGKKSPRPSINSPIQICRGESITIRPNGGTNFNFYTDINASPIHQGSEITFSADNTVPETLFITSTDSLIESEPISTRLEVVRVIPDFDFPRELYLDEQSIIRFTDNTPNAVSWLWDFGDGNTSTLRNPLYEYQAQGNYNVSLTVRTSAGCEATVSKSLVAFRRSPKPILKDMFVCRFDSTTIIPEGGTRFSFYDSPTTDQPVHTGRVYNIGFVSNPKEFWVTSLDSAIESVAAKVRVDFSRSSTDFVMSVDDTLNLFQQDTLFLEDQSNSSVWWYWNFGNETSATTRPAQTTYEREGVYQVTLMTRDTLGCLDSLSKQLIVVDKPVITGGEDGSETAQMLIYPNPAFDYLNVYVELQSTDEVYVQMYNSLGQEILRSEKEWFSSKRFVFDLRNFTQGVYYVRIVTSDQVINQKVVLER